MKSPRPFAHRRRTDPPCGPALLLLAWLTAMCAGQSPPEPPLSPLVVDVVLQPPDGRLEGAIVPSPGETAGLAERPLRLTMAGREVARAQTDSAGRFQVSGLRPGLYQISVERPEAINTQLCRLWTSRAAPPSAARQLLLPLDAPVVRGQVMVPAVSFSRAALLTGVVAGTVAPPIIYGAAQSANKVPASP